MTERKVLWYRHSEPNPERHFHTFLIINEPREISQIKQKLFGQLAPIIQETPIASGTTGDLRYELVTLESTISTFYPNQIYKGKFKWDRRFYPRKTSSGWISILDSLADGSFR